MKQITFLIIISAMMLSLFSALVADTVSIGTGTALEQSYPFHSQYEYSYVQHLYKASQVGISGTISKLRLYYGGYGSIYLADNWTIYMGNTTKNSFINTSDWVPVSEMTAVFSGIVTIPGVDSGVGTWVEITLQTPFQYDNTKNLVIAYDENTPNFGGWAGTAAYWGYYNTGETDRKCMISKWVFQGENIDPASPGVADFTHNSQNRIQLEISQDTYQLTVNSNVPGTIATGGSASVGQATNWTSSALTGTSTLVGTYSMEPIAGGTWTPASIVVGAADFASGKDEKVLLTRTISFSWALDYDIAPDVPESLTDGSITITGANFAGANINTPEEYTPVTNPGFIPTNEGVWQLFGTGLATLSISTDDEWFIYREADEWIPLAGPLTNHSIEVDLGDKDATFEFKSGNGGNPTLPVTLSQFNAVVTAQNFVNLCWISESETNHLGYNVLRSEVKELSTALVLNFSLIDTGQQNGSQAIYNFTDDEVMNNSVYYYWLESVGMDGSNEHYGPITVKIGSPDNEPPVSEVPTATILLNAYPNPFNPSTNLRYSIREAATVKLDVFNAKGQHIRSFTKSHSAPGYYSVVWDGKDLNGSVVNSGVYFFRMNTGKYSSTRKMLMLK